MISQVVYTIILLGSGVIRTWLAYLGWQHGGGRIGRTFAVLMAAVAWWTTFEMLEVAAGSQSGVWRLAKQIGLTAVPVPWLAFTLAYTGHGKLRTSPGGILVYGAAGTLCHRITEQRLERGVYANHTVIAVGQNDAIRRGFEQVLEQN